MLLPTSTAPHIEPITANAIPCDATSQTEARVAIERILSQIDGAHLDSSTLFESFRETSSSPVVVQNFVLAHYAKVANAICKAIGFAVRQYSRDSSLRKILNVPPHVEAVLLTAPTHYEPGVLRPDILHRALPPSVTDDGTNITVCEVNARYPLNGIVISALFNDCLFQECMNPKSIYAKMGFSSVSSTTSFLPALSKRLLNDGKFKVVWVLTNEEKLHDAPLLQNRLGVTFRKAASHQLVCNGDVKNSIFFLDADGSHIPISSAMIYLSQAEISALPKDVLQALANMSFAGHALNDLRSIFIAHNKKMLFVITSGLVQGLDNETLKILRSNVVPTALVSRSSDGQIVTTPMDFRSNYDSFLLKPCLEGKGAGIVMQQQFPSENEFFDYVSSVCQDKEYILQPYVKQRKFDFPYREGHKQEIQKQFCVGMLVTLDNKFYGPCMSRFNSKKIVSVSDGGRMAFAATLLTTIPARVRSFSSSLRHVDTQSVLKNVLDAGMALIGVGGSLENKNELFQFLTQRLGAKCRTHSDIVNSVWDVRPKVGWNKTDARSHTSLPFQVHTDASFDRNPPRFVALAVVSADRNGGGLLSVGRISEAVDMLSEKQARALQEIHVRWIVPPEFKKTGETDVFGPVLMSRDRGRFRRDQLSTEHLDEGERILFESSFSAFCNAIEKVCAQGQMLVPERTVFICDNHRFAHARNMVTDPDRHLLRVRFDL